MFLTNIIDHENFEFHVLYITLIEGCSRKKKIELYTYSKLKFDFPVQPFYCLVDSRAESYQRLKFERIPSTGKNPFVKIVDIDGKPAPFEATRDLEVIRRLLFVSPEAYSEITNLPKYSKELEEQGALIDSLQRELEKTRSQLGRQASFIRLELIPFPLSSPSLRDGGKNLEHNLRQASWSFQLVEFPFEFSRDIGWISSLGYSSLSGNFSIPPKVDTVDYMAVDPDGETYLRIADVKNLSESYSIVNLNFQLAPIYRLSIRNGQFSFYSGIGFNLTTSSKYQCNSGSVTYHGIYPQYNSGETSFDGQYDFGKLTPITSAAQELQMQKYAISWVSGLEYLHELGKDFPLSAGIGLRYFSSRIKLLKFNENDIQVRNANDYQSGLYNYSDMRYGQFSVSMLLSYSIH
ncbi:MAG TPA: hypothetical protein DIW47_11975 [Bacteroidetes bacterium]|nr:hypothetical protein [Bacteroidota bacterium]